MKRILFIILALIICFGFAACTNKVESESAEETPELTVTEEPVKEIVFRNVSWYMSKEEVILAEGREPDITEGTTLVFENVQAGDLPAHVMYIFSNNDELIYAAIPIDKEYKEKGKFVTNLDCVYDYEALRDALTAKYGNPIINERNWSEAKYEYEYEARDWGTATLRGRLEHFSAWQLEDGTLISLQLMGQHFEVYLNIVYACKDASLYEIDNDLPYQIDESINTEGL